MAVTNPLKALADCITKSFDTLVDFHRTIFPNKRINALMTLFWRLVGNKVTPVALSDAHLFGLHFYCEVHGDTRAAAVIVPYQWIELIKKNPILQCGGLVFIASQAQDYYNDKFGKNDMQRRAMGNEAEFLKTALQIEPSYKLNDYQRQVLETVVPHELQYDPKPWNPDTPKSKIL